MTDHVVDETPPRTTGWWPWTYMLAVLAVGGCVLLLALWVGGGAPEEAPPGLPDPGPLVGWTLPAARLLADLAAVVAAGTALTAAILLPAKPGREATLTDAGQRTVKTTAVAAGTVLVAGAAELILTYADFLGITVTEAVGTPGISSFVIDTVQGRALLTQILFVGVVVLAAASVRSTRGAGLLAVLSFAAAGVPALAGHSSSAADHMLAQSSLIVHVVAATAWVGGLVGVALLARRPDVPLTTATSRFSALALWCFVAVGLSGLANAWVRVGSFAEIGSSYGLLAVGKLVALVVLGALGWWHRSRTLPSLETDRRLFVRIAAVEVAVMSATFGLAVALSRTRTPVPEDPPGTPSTAFALLGFELPPPPTPLRLLTEVYVDGYWLAFALLAGALYGTGVRVLARRGDAWPVSRTVSWFVGLVVVVLTTNTGVGTYAMVMFSVHMVQHMTFNMVVPILLVLGAPVTLALRALPARPDGTGIRRLLLDLLKSRFVRLVTHPLVADGLFVSSLYVVYFTGLFDLLMRDHWGHLVMLAHFTLSGLLFFWVLIGIDPGPRRISYPLRMLLLLTVMGTHAFFSVALMSLQRVVGQGYFELLDRPWLTDLVADQRLGGGIGWAFGEIPVLMVLGALFVQWVRADRRQAAAYDRAMDRAEAAAEAEAAKAAKAEDDG